MTRVDFIPDCFDLEGAAWEPLPWCLGKRRVFWHREHAPGHGPYSGPRRRVFTLGVGGPVGSGKTALVERLCREFWPAENLAVITNDIYTREDAEFLARRQVLPLERIVGVETVVDPLSAIREA